MVNKSTILLSFLLIATIALFVQAQSIDAVLDRAEQALGGHVMLEDIEAVRIRSHGTWQMPSRSIPATPFETELVFGRPDRVKLLWKFPEEMGGVFQFGFDGKDTWGLFGGPPARCKGWHREVVLQISAEPQLYLMVPARVEHDGAFALASAVGAGARLVKVSYQPFADGKPWNVWFDKDTGDLVKLEHDSYQMDGKLALFRCTRSEPKKFGGLNYPSRAKFESVRGDEVIESGEETVDAIEINPELPADFFACPKWEVDAATIAVKDAPAETVVKYVHRGPYADIGKSLEPMMDVIMASGLVPVGAASGTYLSDPAASGEPQTELAVRVAKIKEEEPSLPSEYLFTTLPASRVAYAYHRGDHHEEGEAHTRLRAWMGEQGLQPTGPPTAIWYHDPEVTVQEDLVTEVRIPVNE